MKYSTIIFLFCNLLCCAAYSQSQHSRNEQWLKERSNVQKSTVLLNNQNAIIPIRNLGDNRIACVLFDSEGSTVLDSTLNNYSKVILFNKVNTNTKDSTI